MTRRSHHTMPCGGKPASGPASRGYHDRANNIISDDRDWNHVAPTLTRPLCSKSQTGCHLAELVAGFFSSCTMLSSDITASTVIPSTWVIGDLITQALLPSSNTDQIRTNASDMPVVDVLVSSELFPCIVPFPINGHSRKPGHDASCCGGGHGCAAGVCNYHG